MEQTREREGWYGCWWWLEEGWADTSLRAHVREDRSRRQSLAMQVGWSMFYAESAADDGGGAAAMNLHYCRVVPRQTDPMAN